MPGGDIIKKMKTVCNKNFSYIPIFLNLKGVKLEKDVDIA